MSRFHLSYDIAKGSKITKKDVIQFLCGELKCKIIDHSAKSTFIFELDGHELDYIAEQLDKQFPKEFYYVISKIVNGQFRRKLNPELKDDESCNICNMYRLL